MIMTLALAGCSKSQEKERKPSEEIDSTTWIDNVIDGKAAAAKENKKIILFFSSDESDQKSVSLKSSLLYTPEFLEKVTKNYVLVNLDFSAERFLATQLPPDATEEDKKSVEPLIERLTEDMQAVTMYNVETMPTLLLITKEGYVVTPLEIESDTPTQEEFDALLESKAETVAVFDNVLESTESGTKEERLQAINRLFELTQMKHQSLLVDKANEYIKLDKKNETGSVGNYVMSIANAAAVQAYINQDPLTASKEFADAAKSKYLSPEQKQQCFYTAGFLLAQSGAASDSEIIEYLQKSLDAAPESEYAEQIKNMIGAAEESMAEQPNLPPEEQPQQ